MTPLREALSDYRRGLHASAEKKLTPLANLGSRSAMLGLAMLYERGGNGLPRDYAAARLWYARALEAGATEGGLGLARLNFFGHGSAIDYEKSLRLYKILENDGNPIALLMLGRQYQRGLGVDADLLKARAYYALSAKKGNVNARRALGVLEIWHGNPIRGLLNCWQALIARAFYFLTSRSDKRLRNC